MSEQPRPEHEHERPRDRYWFPQQRNGAEPEIYTGPLPPHARPEGVAPDEAILVEFGADLEHPLNIERLVRIISRMCSDHGVTAGHLSYTVVGDEEMHRLNREALNHDYTTDVISFDYTEPAERGSWIEGEVIVNADFASREAGEHHHEPASELLLYCIHGTLHVLGYDDTEPDAAAEMAEMQERYLRLAEA